MNLDFDDDQRLLRAAVRDLLDDQSSPARVREVFEGPEPFDERLWRSGAAMGWMGLTIPEADGGGGFGHLEVAVLAEELGRSLAAVPVSSSLYLATEALLLAGSAEQRERHLPALARGERIGTFAVQERHDRLGVEATDARFADGRLTGTKSPVPDGGIADLAVVVANGGRDLVLVDLAGPGVERTALASIDPSRPLARLVFDDAPAELLGSAGDGPELRTRLLDRAAVLVAFEQLGGAQASLDQAVAYAKERQAFGRAIGSFQAIKHTLADIFAAVELARSNCYYAAWALSSGSDELPIAACLARISATEAFELATQEGLHVHGGLGFTWEHDAHLHLRRSKLLALLLGSSRSWKHTLVDRLAER